MNAGIARCAVDTAKMTDRSRRWCRCSFLLFISAFRRAGRATRTWSAAATAAAQAAPAARCSSAAKAGYYTDLAGLHCLLCRHPCLPAGVPELLKINSLALSVIASQCHIPLFCRCKDTFPLPSSFLKGEALAVHANFPVLPRALPLGELSRQQALTERASPAE